jgi:hypothetical protein
VTLTACRRHHRIRGSRVLNILIKTPYGRNACYIAFVQSIATLVLVNDAGDAGGPYAGAIAIPGSGTVSNSQCTVNAVGSSVSGSGNVLTLTLNISFTGSFAGDRVVYVAARDNAGNNTGWQAKGNYRPVDHPGGQSSKIRTRYGVLLAGFGFGCAWLPVPAKSPRPRSRCRNTIPSRYPRGSVRVEAPGCARECTSWPVSHELAAMPLR